MVIHGRVVHHCSMCKMPCHGILCGVPKSPSDETFGKCFNCARTEGMGPARSAFSEDSSDENENDDSSNNDGSKSVADSWAQPNTSRNGPSTFADEGALTQLLCGLCIGGDEIDMDEEEEVETWITIEVPFPPGAVGFWLGRIVDGSKAGFHAVTKVNDKVCPQSDYVKPGDVLTEIDGWSVRDKELLDVKGRLELHTNRKHRNLKFVRRVAVLQESANPPLKVGGRRGPNKATEKQASGLHASRLFESESSREMTARFKELGNQVNTRRTTKERPSKLSHVKDSVAEGNKTRLVEAFYKFATMATPEPMIDGTPTANWPKVLSCLLLYDPYVHINRRGGRRSAHNTKKQLRPKPVLAIALHNETSRDTMHPVFVNLAQLDWKRSLGDKEVVENGDFDVCFADGVEAAIEFVSDSCESDPGYDSSVFEPTTREAGWGKVLMGQKAFKLSHLQGGKLISTALRQTYANLFKYQESVCPEIGSRASSLPGISVIHVLVQPYCPPSRKGGPHDRSNLVRLKPLVIVTATEGSLEKIDPIIKCVVANGYDASEESGVDVRAGNNQGEFLCLTQPKAAKASKQNALGGGVTPARLSANSRRIADADKLSDTDSD